MTVDPNLGLIPMPAWWPCQVSYKPPCREWGRREADATDVSHDSVALAATLALGNQQRCKHIELTIFRGSRVACGQRVWRAARVKLTGMSSRPPVPGLTGQRFDRSPRPDAAVAVGRRPLAQVITVAPLFGE